MEYSNCIYHNKKSVIVIDLSENKETHMQHLFIFNNAYSAHHTYVSWRLNIVFNVQHTNVSFIIETGAMAMAPWYLKFDPVYRAMITHKQVYHPEAPVLFHIKTTQMSS